MPQAAPHPGAGSHEGALSVLVLLVAAVVWAGHVLKARGVWVSTGSLALLSGIAAGAMFYTWFEWARGAPIPGSLVAFRYDIVMYLLSPVVYYSGFSIKKKAFFSNFGTLMLLGGAGTVLNAALLAVAAAAALSWAGLAGDQALLGNSLALGAVFSSTDSVAALGALSQESHPLLHSLVFGEAVVNDATAIVLVRAVQHVRGHAALSGATLAAMLANFARLFALSLALGGGVGLAGALILRRSFAARHSTDREVALLGVLGFLSFVAAEAAGLSGVFAAFFCGITSSHYSWHQLSPSAQVVSLYAFRVLAFLAEVGLCLQAGLDMWGTSLWRRQLDTRGATLRQAAALAAALTAAVPAARALALAPLLAAAGRGRAPGAALGGRRGAALWWAGCARGAVTLALGVFHFVGSGRAAGREASVQDQIICQACMMAVVVSTVVLGGATPAVLGWLVGDAEGESGECSGECGESGGGEGGRREPLLPSSEHGGGGGAEEGVEGGRWNVHDAWARFDRTYMQPVFGGRAAAGAGAGVAALPRAAAPSRARAVPCGAAPAVEELLFARAGGAGASYRDNMLLDRRLLGGGGL